MDIDDSGSPSTEAFGSRLANAATAKLAKPSLGFPLTSTGHAPQPSPRTVPLPPVAAGIAPAAVALAAAATVAKFKSSGDTVVGIAFAGADSASR
nr:hypothetical protein HK105_004913 [Polyrhizophydium stewartii]